MCNQSDAQYQPCSWPYACVHPQTQLTFAQQQRSGVTSAGYEGCAVRTVEIKPGTAVQNVLKFINSTWLESQVPIYNISAPTPLLFFTWSASLVPNTHS